MATSGMDRKLKIWDLRKNEVLFNYKVAAGAGHMAFSQKGLLAASIGQTVEVSFIAACHNIIINRCANLQQLKL